MAELYEVVNKIIENDNAELENDAREEPETEKETEKEQGREQESQSEDTGYDSRGIENGISNGIGRGAVENIIKNTVYEKYNIDSNAMKEFSRLSPTEMVSDFSNSIKELGQLRSDYSAGKYTKEEYKALSGKLKGEISGKMLEIGSCRKSNGEEVSERSLEDDYNCITPVSVF